TTKIENLKQNIKALSVKFTQEESDELESIASADSVNGVPYICGLRYPSIVIMESLINVLSMFSKTETTGVRRKEGSQINKSLLTLGMIIDEKSLIKKYQKEISSLKQALQQLKRGFISDYMPTQGHLISFVIQHTTEFLWVGPARTDRKHRKHYGAYRHSGIQIFVQNFVHVLAEEGRRLIAYLDDLYEDYKGNKMAMVQ
ncbi:agenet domain-containing protein, partial [Tanacetum coccineum]